MANIQSGYLKTKNGTQLMSTNPYPIGAIYLSVDATNPSQLFGGTWEQWGQGRVPVGVDTTQTEFNVVQKTGGERTHTLSINELPNHTHRIGFNTSWGGPVWDCAVQEGYVGPRNPGTALNYGSAGGKTYVQPEYGVLFNESTGGNQSHNNLQPYITCYMWKRTA